MYKAAEAFSEEARRIVAAGSPFDRPYWGVAEPDESREVSNYVNADGCCIVGALLNAEGLKQQGEFPYTLVSAHVACAAVGHRVANHAMRWLMNANDDGLLNTPEAVREALGV